MDVFVLASTYEGNPLCVMEAMAAGRPVISTAVGGVPQLVDDRVSGLLVEPGDRRRLTEAMTEALLHPGLISALGEAASRKSADAFGVDAMARAYEDLYLTLLESSR